MQDHDAASDRLPDRHCHSFLYTSGCRGGNQILSETGFLKIDAGSLPVSTWTGIFLPVTGTGATITYGAYLGKNQNIPKSAASIAFFDTMVAMIAGFAILPAVFAFGFSPESGPSLMFQTLPAVFDETAGGKIFGVVFFVLVLFAAVSTSIAF